MRYTIANIQRRMWRLRKEHDEATAKDEDEEEEEEEEEEEKEEEKEMKSEEDYNNEPRFTAN